MNNILLFLALVCIMSITSATILAACICMLSSKLSEIERITKGE